MNTRSFSRWVCGVVSLFAVAFASCRAPEPSTGQAVPSYNPKTGKLQQLTLDRNGDGRPDTWADMDGVHLQAIQIDRHGTGHPDRWEYYTEGTPGPGSPRSAGSAFDQQTVIVRAEEANGPDLRTITRREFYTDGVIARVEEDTNFDGRVDKWETYDHGVLVRMDLDLSGRGTPDRRFVYRADGSFDHVEIDQAGDGHFVPAPSGASVPPAVASGTGKTAKGGQQ